MKNEEQTEKVFRTRTWFGVEAVVDVGTGFWHKAGFGNFLIPHPPLVNWLLRLGLSPNKKNRLSCSHEFGHLQTLPVYLIYTVILIYLLVVSGHESLIELVLVLISAHAFWEIITEFYTIYHSGQPYNLYYRDISILPRLLFWLTMTTFTLSGWAILLIIDVN